MRALEKENKPYGVIYCATCSVSGKRYVGQTIQPLEKRIKGHVDAVREGSEVPFHRALRKYTRTAFEFVVLEECASLEALNEAESRWISELGTLGPRGYNCTEGGEGYEVSAETRRRMSAACLGKPRSDAHRRAVSRATKGEKNPFYGRSHTPEALESARAKLSARFSGEGNPFYGRTHTAEVRGQLAARMRGTRMSSENKEALRRANLGNQHTKGRRLSVAHREKLSPLTLEDVRYIRRNPEKLSRRALAERLGVSLNSVRFVQVGRTWVGVE